MSKHPKAIYGLFFVAVVGVLVSFFGGSLFGALVCLGCGIVLLFVMGIAWTRFRGAPKEHHPPSDKILDDTGP